MNNEGPSRPIVLSAAQICGLSRVKVINQVLSCNMIRWFSQKPCAISDLSSNFLGVSLTPPPWPGLPEPLLRTIRRPTRCLDFPSLFRYLYDVSYWCSVVNYEFWLLLFRVFWLFLLSQSLLITAGSQLSDCQITCTWTFAVHCIDLFRRIAIYVGLTADGVSEFGHSSAQLTSTYICLSCIRLLATWSGTYKVTIGLYKLSILL